MVCLVGNSAIFPQPPAGNSARPGCASSCTVLGSTCEWSSFVPSKLGCVAVSFLLRTKNQHADAIIAIATSPIPVPIPALAPPVILEELGGEVGNVCMVGDVRAGELVTDGNCVEVEREDGTVFVTTIVAVTTPKFDFEVGLVEVTVLSVPGTCPTLSNAGREKFAVAGGNWKTKTYPEYPTRLGTASGHELNLGCPG